MMNDPMGETLSRLIDGDDVDVGILAAAIESEEGRRLLVEFASLRHAVRFDQSVPRRHFSPSAHLARATPSTVRSIRRVAFAVAALLIVLGLLRFGFDAGRRGRADTPPRVERVLRFEPSEWVVAKGQ